MNILPLDKSPNIILAGVILLVILSTSLLTSIFLEPLIGQLQANIASLILNFVLTAALIVIYTSMARDQEYQTKLIEKQVEIANQQKEIMEASHLPLLDIELGREHTSQDDLSKYEVKLKNQGNGIAVHPTIGINIHPYTSDNNPLEDVGSEWEPVFDYIYPIKNGPLRRINPGESHIIDRGFPVRSHWPCTDTHRFDVIPMGGEVNLPDEKIRGVAWQIIVRFDTMLPNKESMYRVHTPYYTPFEEEHSLFEDSHSLTNQGISSASLYSPGMYNEDEIEQHQESVNS